MPPTAAPASAPVAITGSTAGAVSRTSASRLLPTADDGHAAGLGGPREEEGAEDAHRDGGDGFFPEPVDNDDPEPPPGYQTLLWPTSSLTLTEAIADLKKGLAQLQPLSATSAAAAASTRTSTAPPAIHAAGVGDSDMSGNTVVRTALGQVSVMARTHDEDAVDTMSRGPLTTRADDAVDASVFRVPPRFAMPVPPASPSTPRAQDGRRPAPGPGPATQQAQNVPAAGSRTVVNALSNSLTARRMVQLTGPGGSYQTHQGSWSVDGMVRQHNSVSASAPVGPGGAYNFTGLGLGRGGSSVTGTLAGSLHGGVNVLLGGAMLSGLILLVFFICYCCQRSARKSDAHFRTQYWLPDPDGPLEVFTLDGQSQRAGAVLLAGEPLDAVVPAPSPPPAYHTVVSLPPQSKPADGGGGGGGAATPSSFCASSPDLGADLKGVPAASSASALCCELDADGLPSYEAALKLESQGHM